MLLVDVPLKVKLIGSAVLAVLIFSLVVTTLEAVNLVVHEGATDSRVGRDGFVSQLGSQSPDSDDNATISNLKFICPFH